MGKAGPRKEKVGHTPRIPPQICRSEMSRMARAVKEMPDIVRLQTTFRAEVVLGTAKAMTKVLEVLRKTRAQLTQVDAMGGFKIPFEKSIYPRRVRSEHMVDGLIAKIMVRDGRMGTFKGQRIIRLRD